MSERAKVLLYTVVASGLLWLGVERFLGTTEEYASRLDIRSTPRDPNWNPEDEVINPNAPINAASATRNASTADATPEPASAAESDEPDEDAPEHDEEEERLTVAERADSDGDMSAGRVSVPRMSAEEAALLERIDPELLRGRPSTRALDLTLANCVIAPKTEGAEPGEVAVTRTLPDFSVAVRYRHGSVAIKGESLNRIDFLVESFRRCDEARLVATRNPEGRVDVGDDERLVVRREEELKYYLLQRRVPMDVVRFPESS